MRDAHDLLSFCLSKVSDKVIFLENIYIVQVLRYEVTENHEKNNVILISLQLPCLNETKQCCFALI